MSAPGMSRRAGFTMLEVLVAVAILATAAIMTWGIFSAAMTAWRKGDAILAEMRHGDFVMEQLVAGLRSAAFFDEESGLYGFHLEDREGADYPADRISWVKSGTAFMPPDSPLSHGLHRIEFTAERTAEGETAVAVRAYPHLAEEDDREEVDPWFPSAQVKGIDCRVYDPEDETWEDEWEDTNNVPGLLEIALFMDPLEPGEDPVVLRRAVRIPIGRTVTGAVEYATGEAAAGGGDEGEAAAPDGADDEPADRGAGAPGAPSLRLEAP
jgi:prepilin-type N-terminal cleavage/methylation domain-containing protein